LSKKLSGDQVKMQQNLKKIAIGSDHAGFELKENIKEFLTELGYEYQDFGSDTAESCDYPIYGKLVGEAVSKGECDCGIAICGTGMGIAIAANKVPKIRATACYSNDMARIGREHNDSNVLTLGARITATELARDIVRTWLNTKFTEAERHVRRIRRIADMEEENPFV